MTSFSFTPERFEVFNEFDKLGLLLGLPRLRGEKNAAYKLRLWDVFVNRADSTYRGLINGITRELGLSIKDALNIRPSLDSLGNTIGAVPVVKFLETKCYVYSDITDTTNGLAKTIDRFEVDGAGYTLAQLAEAITETGLFIATVTDEVDSSDRAMTIFNQSTLGSVLFEDINTMGSLVKLENENLISGTVSISSSNLLERVGSEEEVTAVGKYYVDLGRGVIISLEAPSPGSVIRYKYRDDQFTAKSSPIILHNTQSDDFKSKMFEQIIIDSSTSTIGAPTELGADLINELMSVFPSAWSR